MVHIRTVEPEDAESYLQMLEGIDEESRFMLLEPGERTTTVERQREMINSFLSSPNSMIFVAESDGEIVGYLNARGGDYKRNRHSVYIVCGIREAYCSQGIGTRLFQALEAWARVIGLHRLELTVMSHNERAIALYKKMGFEVEGLKRHSFFVDGRYVDDYYMGKLL